MIPYSELPRYIREMLAAEERIKLTNLYFNISCFPNFWFNLDGTYKLPYYAQHRLKVLWDFHLSMIE